MTTSHDAGREAIARMIALAGLGTITGQPREPHGEWTREDFEARILTIIPTHCEQQCFALADRILQATRPPAQAGAASDKMLAGLLAVIHRDGGQYQDQHGTEKAVADAMTLSAERLPVTPAASGEMPGGMVERCVREIEKVSRFSLNDGRKWFDHPAANEAFEYAIKAIRALTTPKASAETAIPQGWKLVPETMTDAMRKVGAAAIEDTDLADHIDDKPWWGAEWTPCAEAVWSAALSAAPSAPATEAGEAHLGPHATVIEGDLSPVSALAASHVYLLQGSDQIVMTFDMWRGVKDALVSAGDKA